MAFGPNWGKVTPFVLKRSSQFWPGAPYHLGSKKYAADYNEIKLLGGDGFTTASTVRLTRPRSASSGWRVRLWRGTALRGRSRADEGLDLWENARLFGLLNLAMADGYIASWEAKYHYKFWRPVTAIRLGDTDGNPLTEADSDWTPLQPTYPIPDHDSGHAVEGGVAAEVLKQFFGSDRSPSPHAARPSQQVGHARILRR